MNRRDMLKAAVATLATFVLPAPRPRLNLLAFCNKTQGLRYDMRLPYHVDDWCYATNSRICVRVRPETADAAQCQGTVPPFDSLSWNHSQVSGWRTLPKRDPLLADDSCCPACDGTGLTGGLIGNDCETCDGTGFEWVGSQWDVSHPVTCRACKGRGIIPPEFATTCERCEGDAIGRHPTLVELDGRYFDASLYAKAQRLGAEFIHDHWRAMASHDLLKFRFDGGDGLLMGIERAAAERRLVHA